MSMTTSASNVAGRTIAWMRGRYHADRVPLSDIGSLKRYLLRCPSKAPRDCIKIHSVLVLGITGSGKSTFLDACANYLCGNTDFYSGYRLKLVDEPELAPEDEAESKTSTVHSYFLPDPERDGHYIQLIDSPGYADTKSDGLKTEDANTKNIWDFLKRQDELSAVCFVTPASTTRLTATAKYVIGKLTEAFGKDAADNIMLLCTFADDSRPAAVNVVRAGKLPFKLDFSFNNAALFRPLEDAGQLTAQYWNICMQGMRTFFDGVRRARPFSMGKTRAVLEKREAIAAELSRLQDTVMQHVTKMDSINDEMNFVKEHEAAINANKGYTTHRNERRMREKPVADGTYTTYCQLCKSTCHENCAFKNNPEKERCSAMGTNGHCTRCEGKCHWSQHVNVPFVAEYYYEKVAVVHEDLKVKYDSAKEQLTAAAVRLDELKLEADRVESELSGQIARVRALLKELVDIGMTQINFSEAAYLRHLIDQEERGKESGYRGRVALLQARLEKCLVLEWQTGYHDAVQMTGDLPQHAAGGGTGALYVDIPVNIIYAIQFQTGADIDCVLINKRRFGGTGGTKRREIEITPSAALQSVSFCCHENGVMARVEIQRGDGGPPHPYGCEHKSVDRTASDLHKGKEVRLRVTFTSTRLLSFERIADE